MKKQSIVLTIVLFLSLLLMPDCSKAEININDDNLYNSLRGKIILRVEAKGEAYYVHPTKQKMFYLGRPADAFQVMREQGIGITNDNLTKITYEAVGNLTADRSYGYSQRGKIFLQVEESGEAWYVNPGDSMRYYLGRPADAFELMRKLGLGISERDFEKLFKTSSEWISYSNNDFGIELKYPNDNTYSIETPDKNKIIFSQEHPGNRFHISKSTNITITSTDKKIINDIEYTMFKREGMGDPYGYIIKLNGYYFTFESVWGPNNETFEFLMNSVKFIK